LSCSALTPHKGSEHGYRCLYSSQRQQQLSPSPLLSSLLLKKSLLPTSRVKYACSRRLSFPLTAAAAFSVAPTTYLLTQTATQPACAPRQLCLTFRPRSLHLKLSPTYPTITQKPPAAAAARSLLRLDISSWYTKVTLS